MTPPSPAPPKGTNKKVRTVKTYEATPHRFARDEVTQIVAANARHAAAPPLDRLADALEAMAADIDRLAAKVPEVSP